MTNKNLSIFNQLRPVTVGFDNVFDHFERMFDDDSFFRSPTMSNFPPYNIVKTGKNTYDVELALAGFSKDDIEVQYEDNMLSVKSKEKDDKSESKDENGDILHRGISKRWFSKSFTIADDVEVKGAELKDGLLKISMERIIPEGKAPRTIEIK
jgi:molecular chaperone IbpA